MPDPNWKAAMHWAYEQHGRMISEIDARGRPVKANGKLAPCLSVQQLALWGFCARLVLEGDTPEGKRKLVEELLARQVPQGGLVEVENVLATARHDGDLLRRLARSYATAPGVATSE